MKKFLLLILSPWTIAFSKAQQLPDITITRDTLYLNLDQRPLSILKWQEHFYCIFEKTLFPFSDAGTKNFYVFSEQGHLVREVPLPDAVKSETYHDLFIRNDTVIVRNYLDHRTFTLDLENGEWIEIARADDVVYEDDRYIAYFLDYGEWGGKLWFRDKYTGKEYAFYHYGPVVVSPKGTGYTLHTSYATYDIEDLTLYKPADPEEFYQAFRTKNQTVFLKGSGQFLSETHIAPRGTHLITMHAFKEHPLYISTDTQGTYVSFFQGNEWHYLDTIGRDVFAWYPYDTYRHRVRPDGSQSLMYRTYDDRRYGVMELLAQGIRVWHMENTYVEPFAGEKADDVFETLLKLLLQKENIPLSHVDSSLKDKGAIDTKVLQQNTTFYNYPEGIESLPQRVWTISRDSVFRNTTSLFTDQEDHLTFIHSAWTYGYLENENFFSARTMARKKQKERTFRARYQQIVASLELLLGPSLPVEPDSMNPRMVWEMPNGTQISLEGKSLYQGEIMGFANDNLYISRSFTTTYQAYPTIHLSVRLPENG